MFKAVFIDVDNTILDFNACAVVSMQAAMKDFGITFDESMLPVFFKINDSLWHDIELGKLTHDELMLIRWNKVFSALGIDADGVSFEKAFSANLRQSAEKIPYADELLSYLHGKYTVCVTSNAGQEQQIIRLNNAGLIKNIDYVFTSGLIGCQKPSKGFFDGCFSRLEGIGREDVIVIGDSLHADVKGAIDYGLAVCWFNRFEAIPADGIKPDHTVNSLIEITRLL